MENDQNPLWLDDKIQFARLLCEITATAALDHGGWVDLLKSMDLETEELGELFERADKVWEAAKLEPEFELQQLEAAFAEAGGRGVELAERIDELRADSSTYIEKVLEKVLTLSTAHMPQDPGFEGLRFIPFEYGVVVWVSEPGHGVPVWITPAMTLAYDNGCTLILFDRDCDEDPDLPTWDW